MNRPIHFEILSADPAKAAEFCRQALGWEIVTAPGQRYWLASTGPRETPGIDGGIMGRSFPQTVINTVEVASLAESLERIRAAGGTMVFGPHEVSGIGMHAYCADPEGIMFGILQPVAR